MDNGLSVLSLSKKAGRLALGFDMVKQSAVDGKAELIITFEGVSRKTEKEIEFLSGKYNTDFVRSRATMEEALGEIGKRVAVVAVLDHGLAKLYLEKSTL